MFKDIKKKFIPLLMSLALVITNTLGINGALIVKAGTDTSKTFDIVEITDFHGQLLDSTNTIPVGAALAFTLKNLKASNPDRTLIIGGGDLYQGTPTSNVLHGVPVQKVMNEIGMEVTALGNHEFDWGLNVINSETMLGANYKILCANLYTKGTGEPVYDPYKVITKDGVRIAVIGGITNEAPSIILPANTADYEFKDLTTELNKEAQEIRSGNLADIVLADVHEGGDALNDVVSHLQGIDAVFGGHNHQSYDGVVTAADGKNVPVLNAMAQGKGYIDLKITVDGANKITGFSSKGSNWHSVSFSATSPTDSNCKKIVDDASVALLPTFNTVIGNDDQAYTSIQQGQPYGESQLGNWMADVVRTKAEANVGMVNNGGIRLSPIPKGEVTVGTIFNLMPFDNTITTVTMTGAQLKTVLEQAVQDNGKGIQVSGIKFTYDTSKTSYKAAVTTSGGITAEVPGNRIQSITRESDGTQVRPTDILTVAAPDFVGTGGDTFTEFIVPAIKDTYVDSHVLVRDALTDDITNKGKITVVMPNRITNVTQATGAVRMTIAEARTKQTGSAILTGIVTAVNGTNVFIQDDGVSPTAGICVYNNAGKIFTAHKGDKITVTGALLSYKNLLEIKPSAATDVVIESSNNTLTPKEVKISDINSSMQGQLIKIKNATFTSIDNKASSMIQDAQGGSIAVYAMPQVQWLAVNDKADITAAVTQYNTTLELAVDSAQDVVKVLPAIAINDLTSRAGDKTVTLNFSAPTGATSVNVEQSLDGTSFVSATTTSAITESSTSAVVTSLTNGITYNFRLSVIGGEHAGISNVTTATPISSQTTPQAIAINDLTATAGDGRVTLNFSAPTGATSVDVEQSLNGTNFVSATTSNITEVSTNAVVTNLTNGQTYSFRLVVTGGAHAGISNVASATPVSSQTTPQAIAINGLTATAGDGIVTLSFSAPTGATSVALEQSLDGINFVRANTNAITATSTNAVVTGLTNGQTYKFRLVVAGGEHAGTSNVVQATPKSTIPNNQDNDRDKDAGSGSSAASTGSTGTTAATGAVTSEGSPIEYIQRTATENGLTITFIELSTPSLQNAVDAAVKNQSGILKFEVAQPKDNASGTLELKIAKESVDYIGKNGLSVDCKLLGTSVFMTGTDLKAVKDDMIISAKTIAGDDTQDIFAELNKISAGTTTIGNTTDLEVTAGGIAVPSDIRFKIDGTFAKSPLAVFIQHSNGQNLIDKGKRETNKDGSEELSVHVTNYSKFTLVKLPETTVQPTDTITGTGAPEIKFVGLGHSPLVEGDKEDFSVSCAYDGNVQYRIFLQVDGAWQEVTQGYSEAVSGKQTFAITPDYSFQKGQYQGRVYVKKAGQKGSKEEDGIDFDNYYTYNINCVDKDDANRVYTSGDLILDKDSCKAGEQITISGIKGISGITGPYYYRLHIYDVAKDQWTNNVLPYSEKLQWTPKAPGTYVLDVQVITPNSVLWPNVQEDSSVLYGGYEGWKLKTITVK